MVPRTCWAGVGIGSILLALGCSNTGIDAIVPVDAGSEEMGAGGAPPVACGDPVSAVVPGLYTVSSEESGACIARGEETLIAGTLVKGREAVLVTECAQAEAVFRIQTTPMEQGFELRNVESDLSLDIEGYRTEGGTRAVLYDPTGYKNQRFYFTRSAASLTAFAIAAVHTANRCLTATTDGQIQIWECQRGTNQLWRVALADCE